MTESTHMPRSGGSAHPSTTLVVEGGHRLAGRIDVEGNKNAALPLLAACLLTEETCELTNVPRIKDVGVMVELLESLGAEVSGVGTTTLRVWHEPPRLRMPGLAGNRWSPKGASTQGREMA